MNVQIKKELSMIKHWWICIPAISGLMLIVYVLIVCLLAIGVWDESAVKHVRVFSLSAVWILLPCAFCAMTLFSSAEIFADEFEQSNLRIMFHSPVSRKEIWRMKLNILGAYLMAAIMVIFIFIILTALLDHALTLSLKKKMMRTFAAAQERGNFSDMGFDDYFAQLFYREGYEDFGFKWIKHALYALNDLEFPVLTIFCILWFFLMAILSGVLCALYFRGTANASAGAFLWILLFYLLFGFIQSFVVGMPVHDHIFIICLFGWTLLTYILARRKMMRLEV